MKRYTLKDKSTQNGSYEIKEDLNGEWHKDADKKILSYQKTTKTL